MGKITLEQRNRYAAKVKEYKAIMDALAAKETNLLNLLKQPGTQGTGYVRIKLAQEALGLTSYCILINTLSVSLMGIKNEDALADARKALVRGLKYIEDIVTGLIDAPFSEYEKNLEEIAEVSYEDRYLLLRKFGFALGEIEDGYGANSKWKWSFAETWGKVAVMGKNLLDLKKVYQDLELDSPNRIIVHTYLATVKRLFQDTADRYREKYEMFSSKMEDFKQAILFLSALRRIHIVLGDRNEAEELKKKIDIWTTKLEADQKRREEESKRR